MNRETRRSLRRTPVVSDESLIAVEIYNHNAFDLVFFRVFAQDEHVTAALGGTGPETIVCKSKEFCNLPHQYYKPQAYTAGHAGELEQLIADSPPIQVTVNYGNAKGIRNTKASSPVAPKFNHRRIR